MGPSLLQITFFTDQPYFRHEKFVDGKNASQVHTLELTSCYGTQSRKWIAKKSGIWECGSYKRRDWSKWMKNEQLTPGILILKCHTGWKGFEFLVLWHKEIPIRMTYKKCKMLYRMMQNKQKAAKSCKSI